ncbi:glycosyl transferase [Paenibacillus swuensis]|uniref:Glycosyl transferase n=1 Tax=Paenibacillus swuensis TaxID=1178515 RepID=A0A172TGS2_9BACL|nr:glycosyltransferase [Paenibacillus swuensis]ANE46255.1 glycosyl transferase [Paenibacillus swuensis]
MLHEKHIPRVIHYCWFGRGEKTGKIARCMKSWQKHLGDYTLMEWNEDNFDLNTNRYVKEAYEARKYAFVSDYVRLHALYTHGGIYMDTDVEVLQPLDRFLTHEAFSGFEDEQFASSSLMGAAAGHPWIAELMEYYGDRPFHLADGAYDMTTNTAIITRSCAKHGFKENGVYQVLTNGVTFYPRTYFCPYDYINGANFITEQSYAIHHFAKSWLPLHVRVRGDIKRVVSRYLGPGWISKLRALVNSK